MMSMRDEREQEIIKLVMQWRDLRRDGGHREVNAVLAKLLQAADRYDRTVGYQRS